MVVRLSALGDVAMLPHTLRAFKAAYPEVRVTVLTRDMLAPLFDGLDVEFLFADTKGHHRGIGGLWRLAGDIKALGVDAIADVHGVSSFIKTRPNSEARPFPLHISSLPTSAIRGDFVSSAVKSSPLFSRWVTPTFCRFVMSRIRVYL